jgi:hypothetical protein
MPDEPAPPSDLAADERRPAHDCGKIFPLPGELPRETPDEFAVGIGVWCGDVFVALGPDGDLYYTTLAGDGVARKIVSA